MADMSQEEDGSWLWWESHCPICSAARACQGLCRSELALFRRLLAPAEVERGSICWRGQPLPLSHPAARPESGRNAKQQSRRRDACAVAFGEGCSRSSPLFPDKVERLMGLLTR